MVSLQKMKVGFQRKIKELNNSLVHGISILNIILI